jgi:hypothetical protein
MPTCQHPAVDRSTLEAEAQTCPDCGKIVA